jgi:hypothetical protein
VNYVDRFLSRLTDPVEIGDGKWKAVCPVHADSRPSLNVSLSQDGRIITRCMAGCDNDAVRKALGLSWGDYYPGVGEDPVEGSVPARRAGKALPGQAQEAKWHDTYSEFLAGLVLTPEHREHLRARGLTDKHIDAAGYKSLKWGNAKVVLKRMENKYTREALSQVPGFGLDKEGSFGPVIKKGLLIPVRDLQGKILALKIRQDHDPKYIWLSGNGSPSVGSPPHVAFTVFEDKTVGSPITLVEGPLKADIVQALRPTAHAVGVGGVASWAQAAPLIPESGVIVAFDGDWRDKPEVARQFAEAVEGFQKLGKPVWVEVWAPEAGKGLDDVLFAKRPTTIMPAEEGLALLRTSSPARVPTDPPPSPRPATGGKEAHIIWADTITPEVGEWTWEGWIPKGSFTLLEGEGGIGKGLFAIDLAARLTRGWNFPPHNGQEVVRQPSKVLIVSSEDSYKRVLTPRFLAAGGDTKMLGFFDGLGPDRDLLTLPQDIGALDREVKKYGVGLVLLDPLTTYLNSSVDMDKDNSVRRVLTPIYEWVEREGVVMLAIRHWNKATKQQASFRGLGSVAFTNQARSMLAVIQDPDDQDKNILVQVKNNYGKKQKGLMFTKEQVDDIPGIKKKAGQVRLLWLKEEVTQSVDDLLQRKGAGDGEELRRMLEEQLTSPRSAAYLLDYAQQLGIHARAAQRARIRLGYSIKRVVIENGPQFWAWGPANWDWKNKEKTLEALKDDISGMVAERGHQAEVPGGGPGASQDGGRGSLEGSQDGVEAPKDDRPRGPGKKVRRVNQDR